MTSRATTLWSLDDDGSGDGDEEKGMEGDEGWEEEEEEDCKWPLTCLLHSLPVGISDAISVRVHRSCLSLLIPPKVSEPTSFIQITQLYKYHIQYYMFCLSQILIPPYVP